MRDGGGGVWHSLRRLSLVSTFFGKKEGFSIKAVGTMLRDHRVVSLQLHGGRAASSEGGWLPHEEGARLLWQGFGQPSAAFPGHPRRVRSTHHCLLTAEDILIDNKYNKYT